MNEKYVYIHLATALILTLVLAVPEFVTFPYRTGNARPAERYHAPPAWPPAQPRRHHAPPPPAPLPGNSPPSTEFPRDFGYWHTVKNTVFFFCMSFVMLAYNTFRLHAPRDRRRAKRQNRRLLFLVPEDLLLCLLFFALYVWLDDRPGARRPLDGMLALKCTVVAIVSYLFVFILLLIRHRQQVMLENEQLNTQNIQVQYEALANQVNPHFLFNSLNTLSALIREHQDENALKYINKLSDIFRYALYSNNQSIRTLDEELEIIDAYRYLLKIRYEDNLLFDIRIDEKYRSYLLPNLSLQLLIENIIKHNEVSAGKPLLIDIYTVEKDQIVVSNRIQQKWCDIRSPGIGLKNLNKRYRLLFSKEIIVENNGSQFTVRLPLINENSGL
ncbi:MAG: histidine kinase [Tannerellaceae bacterium]|jgi:hypothetical protein|nr:histidine kinase [Tannerellaceae bacterium]